MQENDRNGFSLVEVLISSAVIAVAILSLFLVLTHGLRAAQVTTRQAEAMHHARTLVDVIRVRNLAFVNFPANPTAASGVGDAAGTRRPLADAPFTADIPANTGLERNVVCERVGASASSYEYELMRISVTVFYTEQGHRRQIRLQALQARP